MRKGGGTYNMLFIVGSLICIMAYFWDDSEPPPALPVGE